MMAWIKLLESDIDYIQRGTLLKFHASYPFEEEVIMMVCEGYGKPFQKGLITISGFKAGINSYVFFPEIATIDGLSRRWVVENWTKWVWPDGDVETVLIREVLRANEL